jgi:hypothetical protein
MLAGQVEKALAAARNRPQIKTSISSQDQAVPRYSHAFDFAVQLVSETPDGRDVTPAALRAALLERVLRLSDQELIEACGLYDTHEVDPPAPEMDV